MEKKKKRHVRIRPSDNSQRFFRYSLRFTTVFFPLFKHFPFSSSRSFFSKLVHQRYTRNPDGVMKLFFFFFSPEFVVQVQSPRATTPFFSFYSSKWRRRGSNDARSSENKGRRGCARDGSKCHTRERVSGLCDARECG